MSKRITITHLRKLVNDTNGLPINRELHVHINLRVLNTGYVLAFTYEDMDPDETNIMSCKECYCYLLGMFRSAQHTEDAEVLEIMQEQQDKLLATIRNYEVRIVENAKALHKMFLEKETLKKNFNEAMSILGKGMATLTEKVAALEHTLEEEAHMHNEN